MTKRKRNSVDPKERLRLLKEDLDKKTAQAAKAQEKLRDEENRQLEKCVKELQSLCKKAGGDIYDAAELIRLFAERKISIIDEIKRLSGVQLDFDSIGNVQDDEPDESDSLPENSPPGNGEDETPGGAVKAVSA